jgi:hypothetical protein
LVPRACISLHNEVILESRRLASSNAPTLEKGLTAKIFDNQCELHVIRMILHGMMPRGVREEFLSSGAEEELPRKKRAMSCMNPQAAAMELAVPVRLSFA